MILLAFSNASAVEPAKPEAAPEGYVVRPLLQQSLGFYSVLLPPDYDAPANKKKVYPLCLLLHGSGSTEKAYLPLVNDALKREGVIYLTPRAPYPHPWVFLHSNPPKPGYTAWPEYTDEASTFQIAKGSGPSDREIEKLYTDWIARCVQDARTHYRIAEGKIAVFGHSQGASFGFCFAVDHPELVKACFLADGYYDSRLKDDDAGKVLRENHIQIDLIHNEDDPVVKVEQGRDLVAYLKKNGDFYSSTFPHNGGHSVTPGIKAQAAAFVEKWCRHP